MTKVTNRALAAALAVTLIFGSGTFALADRGGNGHGKGESHAKVSAHAKAASTVRGTNAARHSKNDNDNDNENNNGRAKNRGSSATAHSCVNPAGNTRGWCKSKMGGAFITGTVASINGSTALVTLSNGQQITINTGGRNLTVGQQITLRGTFDANGVFVPSNGTYNNYGGPYSGASVRGLIISVNGNSIQIAQGLSLITINDSTAASRGAISGTLIPGRTITAYGNWSGSTFMATSIQ